MSCCDDCKHKHVCKYKEVVDKFYNKIDDLLDNVVDKDIQDIFSIEIKCKNHSWDYPKEWDIPGVKGIKLPTTITTDGTNNNPCDGCMNNLKNMPPNYIGDWPCQWCDKSPLKVTCTSTKSN